ncbi:MAG: hypothetical protein KAT68_04520 [Bacteroidales bacterium]|nr:hypothetical protein [Bacteroidales bacterium]
MGLFETSKKERNILDLFTYDLTTFFYGNYEEVDSEETEGTFMIVYERILPWVELNIFDAVQFRVFFDKNNITGSNPINVKFIIKENEPTKDNIQYIIDQIIEIYGSDDGDRGEWSENDDKDYENGRLSRIWTIETGESFVSISYNKEENLVLNILFFNNLIKHTGKYLDIKH